MTRAASRAIPPEAPAPELAPIVVRPGASALGTARKSTEGSGREWPPLVLDVLATGTRDHGSDAAPESELLARLAELVLAGLTEPHAGLWIDTAPTWDLRLCLAELHRALRPRAGVWRGLAR